MHASAMRAAFWPLTYAKKELIEISTSVQLTMKEAKMPISAPTNAARNPCATLFSSTADS